MYKKPFKVKQNPTKRTASFQHETPPLDKGRRSGFFFFFLQLGIRWFVVVFFNILWVSFIFSNFLF